jgi:hypothetical protein
MIQMPSLSDEAGRLSDGLFAGLAVGEIGTGVASIEEQLAALRELAALPGFLDESIGALLLERRRDYRAFWHQARLVAALFRTTYVTHDDRERLWREYSNICRQVRELGRVEWEDRAAESAINSERVRSLVREASHWVRGGRTGTDLTEARARLRQAMDVLKTASFLQRGRQECFGAWREAADALEARWEEIHQANFDSLIRELRDAAREVASGNTFEAAGLLRVLKAQLQAAEVSGEQRSLLRDELHDLWGKLIRRIEARKAELTINREVQERRREDWRDRQARRLEDLAEWREQNGRRIERLGGEAEELEGQIANAWNEDWAGRARGWVQAKYAKIRDLETRNEELERQTAEIRRLLNQQC